MLRGSGTHGRWGSLGSRNQERKRHRSNTDKSRIDEKRHVSSAERRGKHVRFLHRSSEGLRWRVRKEIAQERQWPVALGGIGGGLDDSPRLRRDQFAGQRVERRKKRVLGRGEDGARRAGH